MHHHIMVIQLDRYLTVKVIISILSSSFSVACHFQNDGLCALIIWILSLACDLELVFVGLSNMSRSVRYVTCLEETKCMHHMGFGKHNENWHWAVQDVSGSIILLWEIVG
jgi:hypothetical protein